LELLRVVSTFTLQTTKNRMSRSYHEYNGVEYPEYYRGNRKARLKGKRDRKRFVHRGDGWATKSQGGPGNKRAYGHFTGMAADYPRHMVKSKKRGESETDLNLIEL
jgi:hypothetical protein